MDRQKTVDKFVIFNFGTACFDGLVMVKYT